jgi:acetyl-CoA carboxylase carboxyl transferase subunit alpha
MLENSWYSVISPENCSSILWRSWEHKEKAADALKLTATDAMKLNVIDEIVNEPLGGDHTVREGTFVAVRDAIVEHYDKLKNLSQLDLVSSRMD